MALAKLHIELIKQFCPKDVGKAHVFIFEQMAHNKCTGLAIWFYSSTFKHFISEYSLVGLRLLIRIDTNKNVEPMLCVFNCLIHSTVLSAFIRTLTSRLNV